MKSILVTGGAGFIGCNFVRFILGNDSETRVTVYDKLTYAGRLENLADVETRFGARYAFVQGDICDAAKVEETVTRNDIDTIVNFAAETHVDRSILDPDAFVQTDVYGTYVILEAARRCGNLRFHQISTDEVYGHIDGTHRSTESDSLALPDFQGRYLHLLIQQEPNIPVWKYEPGEEIKWRAAALQCHDGHVLLVFSSLPKAVAFLQPAVIDGLIRDINKVGKFSRATSQTWQSPVMINPTLDAIRGNASASGLDQLGTIEHAIGQILDFGRKRG